MHTAGGLFSRRWSLLSGPILPSSPVFSSSDERTHAATVLIAGRFFSFWRRFSLRRRPQGVDKLKNGYDVVDFIEALNNVNPKDEKKLDNFWKKTTVLRKILTRV
ncbi:hypothetical protein L1887_04057 [Cichorium endivia]|nr:hypothetical protein L1887_04057 [Cichorium endivia]